MIVFLPSFLDGFLQQFLQISLFLFMEGHHLIHLSAMGFLHCILVLLCTQSKTIGGWMFAFCTTIALT